MKIIGVTGSNRAGKGTFAALLVDEYHFTHFSSGEFISDWMKTVGIPLTGRYDLANAGNELRRLYKPDIVARSLFTLAEYKGVDAVIESIRNQEEARFIQSHPNGFLVSVDADPVIRYKRARDVGGIKDGVTIEEFIREEEWEMGSEKTSYQNIRKCMEMADVTIINNGTTEELRIQGRRFMEMIEHGGIERR